MGTFSSITDRVTQLPLSQKVLLAVVGFVFLGAALGYFLLMPLWNKSKLLQEDISREKIKLVQIQQARAQIARFKQELAEMDVRYKQIQIMLPEAKEIPHLLKNVSNLGQQQGLEFLLFKPEKENNKEFVAEIPVTLHLKGSYHQIGVFFDRIRRLPRIVNIKQLEMGTFEEKTTKITARCQLVTFRVLPPPSPLSLTTPKAKVKK
ncbi:MAG: type 4a pilus biogenesis protein PilO [Deltaproteobacteria bacterium]|nr:type 4a pilus biogenesis protein PilO [Deltaproteobacteria bacterium]